MSPLRVAVLDVQVPFVFGGGEMHAAGLCRALAGRGHEVDLVTLPLWPNPPERILDAMLSWTLVDVDESAGRPTDRAIALRFPSYLARHPRKSVWLVHQHRAAYELWQNRYGDMHGYPAGERVRRAIHAADAEALGAVSTLRANSRRVAERLLESSGLEAAPLHHPPPLAGRLEPGPDEGFLFAPSRIEAIKRQDLLVEALARTRHPIPCRLPGTGGLLGTLRTQIDRLGLAARVEAPGWIEEPALVAGYRGARAVFYGPYDEDLGYVTLEAFLAAKPVVTLADAGGPLEFVEHGVTGLVVPPEPGAIAEALDRLWDDPALAAALGRRGRERVLDLGLSWDRVVDALTLP